MSPRRLDSPTGTRLKSHEFMKMPLSSHDSNAVKNKVSSQVKLHVESNKRVSKLRKDAKSREKNNFKHPISEYSGKNLRSRKSSLSHMSHPGMPWMSGSASYSRARRLERSISREPGSVPKRAVESLERKGKEHHTRNRRDLFENAKESIEVAKRSPKLERSRSAAIGYSHRDAEIGRYNEKRSSKKDSRRSKSSALVAKPNSKLTLSNEKLGQTSLPSHVADKRAVEGKVFGILFFTGKTGRVADANVKKDGKKDKKEKKDKKDTKRKIIEKNTKEENKTSAKKTEGKRTRKHSTSKKAKKSDGDRQVKADNSRAKKSGNKNRKNSKSASSKNLKTLCEFEISPDKNVSGLVVKVHGKRS